LTTLKEFEDALREQGMNMALAILQKLRERDRAKRSVAPARRIAGRKMTPDLAKRILELHATTEMTQQEIAFELGVNQGRVNEVIKRGKWLDEDPTAPEAVARDRAKARMAKGGSRKAVERQDPKPSASRPLAKKRKSPGRGDQSQLILGDL
jgi:anaerobic glycerol-3-phosphate dehydrogenase